VQLIFAQPYIYIYVTALIYFNKYIRRNLLNTKYYIYSQYTHFNGRIIRVAFFVVVVFLQKALAYQKHLK